MFIDLALDELAEGFASQDTPAVRIMARRVYGLNRRIGYSSSTVQEVTGLRKVKANNGGSES
jgi:hypothetical protein